LFFTICLNQDDYRHAALCTGLGKTYFTKTSSKHRVVTAKIFEFFTLLTRTLCTEMFQNVIILFFTICLNQDNYRHAALCTGLGKTYFTKTSSKHRVVTAKIFVFWPHDAPPEFLCDHTHQTPAMQ
jgi:hypothetical protein